MLFWTAVLDIVSSRNQSGTFEGRDALWTADQLARGGMCDASQLGPGLVFQGDLVTPEAQTLVEAHCLWPRRSNYPLELLVPFCGCLQTWLASCRTAPKEDLHQHKQP